MLGASRRFVGAGIATGVSLEIGDRAHGGPVRSCQSAELGVRAASKRTKRTLTVVSMVGVALLWLLATAPAGAKPTPAYTLTDVGTFGGPQDFLNLPGEPLTRQGGVIGTADTTTPDEDFPNFNPFIIGFPNPTIARAFVFQMGGSRISAR